MNRPPSRGQHFRTGSAVSLTSSPCQTMSWHLPLLTIRGAASRPILASPGSNIAFPSIVGGIVDGKATKSAIRFAASSNDVTPRAIAMRLSEPYIPIATLNCEPVAFSKTTAGPPLLTKRSAIAVISRTGLTSTEIRLSSPSASSARTKSNVPSNGMATLHLISQSGESVPVSDVITTGADFQIRVYAMPQTA